MRLILWLLVAVGVGTFLALMYEREVHAMVLLDVLVPESVLGRTTVEERLAMMDNLLRIQPGPRPFTLTGVVMVVILGVTGLAIEARRR